MKVSYHALQQWVKIDLPPEQLAEQLTQAGLEVEACLSVADDVVFDISLTPNRGDCLSTLGVAREVAALNDLVVKKIPVQDIEVKSSQHVPVKITAEQACPRYAGRVISGINNRLPTPTWMQDYLQRADVKSISLIVDVLNYVMLEIGQPMHAFDLSKITKSINVRFAKKEESLTLLDEQHITLMEDVLVIADEKKALALAGIMGGLESSVTADTTDIFIESAFFSPHVIQGRARRFALQTDASHRFERGVDPLLPVIALDRATELLINIGGGKAGPAVDITTGQQLESRKTISLSYKEIERLLGVVFSSDDVTKQLRALGMLVEENKTGWEVIPPSYRFDIHQPVDLLEEIARIFGYSRMPATASYLLMTAPTLLNNVSSQQYAKTLIDRGYNNVITYSFVDPVLQKRCEPEQIPVPLKNPIASDLSVMRTSLWPGLLSTLQYNANRQISRIRCFEQGLCFIQSGGELQQQSRLGAIAYGSLLPEQWQKPARAVDFYAMKADVETLLGLSGRSEEFTIVPATHPTLHPGKSAAILHQQDKIVGYVGAIHPQILQSLGIKGEAYGFELQLIPEVTNLRLSRYAPLSRFPQVRRDLALVLQESVSAQALEKLIKQICGKWLQNLTIFDVYRGESIQAGHKSVAVGITLQAVDRTLTDAEVDAMMKNVIAQLRQQLNAEIRE